MSLYDVAPVTVEDYRRGARLKLPRFLFDYIDGTTNNKSTFAANTSDFYRIKLKQRVIRDVSGVHTSTPFLGEKVAMALVRVGMASMFARPGRDTALSRGHCNPGDSLGTLQHLNSGVKT